MATEIERRLMTIPNVGPRFAADLISLGITRVEQLKGKDPLKLYRKLEKLTASRQDPCVLDTFIAIVDFAGGTRAKPWFAYTAGRKSKYPKL